MKANVALVLPWIFICTTTVIQQVATNGRICSGSDFGVNIVNIKGFSTEGRGNTRKLYENCTIVNGNLEIGYLSDDTEQEYLENIEEVTGYVLVHHNKVKHLSLPNLQVIWGDSTAHMEIQAVPGRDVSQLHRNYALLVFNNLQLETLSIPKLRVINNGSVGLLHNPWLCHWKTLDFKQFMAEDYNSSRLYISSDAFRNCIDPESYACHPSCKYCFDSTEAGCQDMYYEGCAAQCSATACYSKTGLPQHCCHSACLGGCTGPKDTDCIACRGMREGKRCVNNCKPRIIYDTKYQTVRKDPSGKFIFGRQCVDNCPDHVRVYNDVTCVSRCPDGYYEDDRKCVQCQGVCPKTCSIDHYVSSRNIKDFINCTQVQGMIEIRKDTFEKTREFLEGKRIDREPLTAGDLQALENVQIVTDYIYISTADHLENLKFLKNLKVVEGRRSSPAVSETSFIVGGNKKLTQLGFSKLEKVKSGNLVIKHNDLLCNVDAIPFNASIAPGRSFVSRNGDKQICDSFQRCHETCDQTKGCWGFGPDMCFECSHVKLGAICIRWCNSSEGFYRASEKVCEFCHPECNVCTGPGDSNCTSCKNVELNGTCVKECPSNRFFVDNFKRCLPCHENCGDHGCTGPGNFVGLGGCNKCDFGHIDKTLLLAQCLPTISNERSCSVLLNQSDYYWGAPNLKMTRSGRLESKIDKGVCAPCNNECSVCTSFGREEKSHGCRCKTFRVVYEDTTIPVQCDSKCLNESFYVVENGPAVAADCRQCDSQCLGCFGPSDRHCFKCRHYTLVNSSVLDNWNFTCVPVCPSERKYFDKSGFCTDIDEEALSRKSHERLKVMLIMTIPVGCLLLLGASLLAIFYCRRYKRAKKLNPPDEEFEMNPDAKPDLSQLRIIVEFELKMSEKPLGTGAFGVVFKGIWQPQGQKVRVPVAIKVLHDSTPGAQKEMLDEAALMARMNHKNLLRLVGVCFGSRMMLITPLMALGNLLDFLHKNKLRIGSVDLLRWATQIASGMEHLEKNRLVHRDLAARNVLVKNPYHVLITDFGLAKMMDYGEQELKVYEGRMPIKWLAPECISQHRYTHKSDVWAFGVTLWELFTYGEKPYEGVPLNKIPALLLSGQRLPQPKICTLDVYSLLLQSWMENADARATFSDLSTELANMFRDPPRYLVVERDGLLRLPSSSIQQQNDSLSDFTEEPDISGRVYLDDVLSPPMPPTPSKPLLRVNLPSPRTAASHRNQSTSSSHRYASDPLKIRGVEDLDMSSVPTIDFDNYLMPDSAVYKPPSTVTAHECQDLANDFQNHPVDTYTPVITGASPGASRTYYNDLTAFSSEQMHDADFIDEGIQDDQSPSTSSKCSSVKSNDAVVVAANFIAPTLSSPVRCSPVRVEPTFCYGSSTDDLFRQQDKKTTNSSNCRQTAGQDRTVENLEYILPGGQRQIFYGSSAPVAAGKGGTIFSSSKWANPSSMLTAADYGGSEIVQHESVV